MNNWLTVTPCDAHHASGAAASSDTPARQKGAHVTWWSEGSGREKETPEKLFI